MKIWIYLWAIIVLFSLISFTYMSIKILYSGYAELKIMLTTLENEQEK